MKNNKIILSIIVGIIVIAVGAIAVNNQESDMMEVEDVLNKELRPDEKSIPEIQESLDEIEEN